jgi:hypothetical protein
MNLTKAAAIIALVVSALAVGYVGFVFIEDRIAFRAEIAILTCSQMKRQHGADYPCEQENTAREYEVSGSIALVGLITSLALFRAGRRKK